MPTKSPACSAPESPPASESSVPLPRPCSGSPISPRIKLPLSPAALCSPATPHSPGPWAAASTTNSSVRSPGDFSSTTSRPASSKTRRIIFACRLDSFSASNNAPQIFSLLKNRIPLVGGILFLWPRRKLLKPDCANSRAREPHLSLPIFMIAQEVILVPVIHRRLQEQPSRAPVSHFFEPAVCRINSAADDPKAFAFYLLCQQIIFGEGHLLVKSAQLPELFQLEQHEHSGGKGMVQSRCILEEIVAHVEQLVDPVAVAAQDVRGHAVQLLPLRPFHRAPHHRGMRQFDVCIEKQNVGALRLRRSQVAPNRRHPAPDHTHIQPVAKTQNNFARAVGRVGVSDQHSRTRHLRVILIHQRSQQTRNQIGLVLGRNHDGQFADCVRARRSPARRGHARCIHGCALLVRPPSNKSGVNPPSRLSCSNESRPALHGWLHACARRKSAPHRAASHIAARPRKLSATSSATAYLAGRSSAQSACS